MRAGKDTDLLRIVNRRMNVGRAVLATAGVLNDAHSEPTELL